LWLVSNLAAGAAWAQPFTPNEMGVTMGHWHLNSRDVEAQKKIFVGMGGTAGPPGDLQRVVFPGVVVNLNLRAPPGPPTGGTIGTVVPVAEAQQLPFAFKSAAEAHKVFEVTIQSGAMLAVVYVVVRYRHRPDPLNALDHPPHFAAAGRRTGRNLSSSAGPRRTHNGSPSPHPPVSDPDATRPDRITVLTCLGCGAMGWVGFFRGELAQRFEIGDGALEFAERIQERTQARNFLDVTLGPLAVRPKIGGGHALFESAELVL
jgi:hypothetical protein